MKKLLLFSLLITSNLIECQSNMDLLEQAIQESNINSVRSLLSSISISSFDKERLLILAEDVIQQRRSLLALVTPSKSDFKMLLVTPALLGSALIAAILEYLLFKTPELGGDLSVLLCFGAALNIPVTIIKHFYDARAWYTNVIAIKTLLYKTKTCE